jgi:hypothetical protein
MNHYNLEDKMVVSASLMNHYNPQSSGNITMKTRMLSDGKTE